MTSRPDFVLEVTALAREVVRLEPQDEARLADAIRRRYGGATVRIQPEPPKPPVTIEAIDQRLRARKPVVAIAEELGVSRSTIYRALARNCRKRRARCDTAAG